MLTFTETESILGWLRLQSHQHIFSK